MKAKILQRPLHDLGLQHLPSILAGQLPGSTLNSVLLEIFHLKTTQLQPADVLRAYAENRFVRPSSAPFFKLVAIKNDLLQRAASAGFEPLQLSPACPLGTCSVVALAHQDKVVSATRGTELVADATNVLALETALRRKGQGPEDLIRLCASHRHIRTQVFDLEGFTPHFDIFCMTSAGRDTGHFSFEKTTVAEHLLFYHSWAKTLPGASGFRAVFTPFSTEGVRFCESTLPDIVAGMFPIEVKPAEPEGYYRFLRCKILLTLGTKEWEIGDCGFTNWTARLLSNRKERFFISGLGVEMVAKLAD